MKAMIFAAGVGSRLKPFTLNHPKAMAPVGGKPVLERVIDRLVAAGADSLVVNVHHFSEQIVDFLQSKDFGVSVQVSDESDLLLDTGGGILKARPMLDGAEPFVVHNADIVSNLDIRDMYLNHVQSGADVTLLATERVTSRYLFFDKKTRLLVGWCNEKNGECRPAGFTPDTQTMYKLAFGGAHIISPTVFDVLQSYKPIGMPFSITPFYVDSINKLKIQFYTPGQGFKWCDIGTPETLERANELIKNM